MSDVSVIAPGMPSWADVALSNIDEGRKFYSSLFGWNIAEGQPEYGGYAMADIGGKSTAALSPLMDPQQPPAWMVYFSTDDAKATAQKVKDAGGQVAVEPMQVADQGTMAIFIDPTGAFFGVWQPDQMKGADSMLQTGGITWMELWTKDGEAAKQFYPKVFGWTPKASEGMNYTEWQLDGRSIAGMMPMDDSQPAMPPHWTVYFSVDDVAAATQKAEQLGAKVFVQAQEFPGGTFSIVQDPQGPVFGLLKMKPNQQG